MRHSREDLLVQDEAVRWNLQHGVEWPYGELSRYGYISPRGAAARGVEPRITRRKTMSEFKIGDNATLIILAAIIVAGLVTTIISLT